MAILFVSVVKIKSCKCTFDHPPSFDIIIMLIIFMIFELGVSSAIYVKLRGDAMGERNESNHVGGT